MVAYINSNSILEALSDPFNPWDPWGGSFVLSVLLVVVLWARNKNRYFTIGANLFILFLLILLIIVLF